MAEKRLLRVSELWQALDDAGIAKFSYGKKWIKRQEDAGRLILPDRPSQSAKRKFTREQIDQIVAAFSPGGPYTWIWPGKQSK